jgi:hypothetical protein
MARTATVRKLPLSEKAPMKPSPIPAEPTNADLAKGQADLHLCLDGARTEIRSANERLDGFGARLDGMGTRLDAFGATMDQVAARVGAGKKGEIKNGRPLAWIGAGGAAVTLLAWIDHQTTAWPTIEAAGRALLAAGRAILAASGAH